MENINNKENKENLDLTTGNNSEETKPLAVEIVETRLEDLEPAVPPAKILTTITDKNFGTFELYDTFNGWWKDVVKVRDLITCFKNAFTVEQAFTYIGISKEQYYYFLQLHPDFSRVKEACEILADAVILNTAHKAARDNGKLAMMWLDKRGFFDKNKKVEPPSMVQNNIQINHGVNEITIKEAISRFIKASRSAGDTGEHRTGDATVEGGDTR